MANCKHAYIGKEDGVHCTRCGLHLTTQQYRELLHPPESAQNGADTAASKEPAKVEKNAQTGTEPPQAKPKQTRKNKEASTNE